MLVRRVRRSLAGTVLPLLLLTFADPALGAVLNKKARLRDGATRLSTLLDWVDAGTTVTVTGVQEGWYRIVLPDGREGFIWGEHLDQVEAGVPVVADSPAPGTQAEGPPATSPGEPRATTLQDDVQALRAQLEGYTQSGGLAAKADLDRLLDRVDRLTKEHEALRQSLDDSVFTGARTPVDGSAIAGGAFLTVGGILGWVLARLSQRRRDRRGRIRL
jgi:hypothetical protein